MNIEIERKFLVVDDSYRTLSSSSSLIRQGYIVSGGGRTVRVRQRDDKAFLTIKGPSADGGLSRFEFETEISLQDAEGLFALCEPGRVEKRRYLVPWEGRTFEVDEFIGENEGLVFAELELPSADAPFSRPPFLGEEVTGNPRFYNTWISKHPLHPRRPEGPSHCS